MVVDELYDGDHDGDHGGQLPPRGLRELCGSQNASLCGANRSQSASAEVVHVIWYNIKCLKAEFVKRHVHPEL